MKSYASSRELRDENRDHKDFRILKCVLFWRQTHAHTHTQNPLRQQLKNTLLFASPFSYAVSFTRYPESCFSMFTSFNFKRWTQEIFFFLLLLFLSYFWKTKGKIDFSSVAWNFFIYFSLHNSPCQLPSSPIKLAYECNESRKYGKNITRRESFRFGSAINCKFFENPSIIIMCLCAY